MNAAGRSTLLRLAQQVRSRQARGTHEGFISTPPMNYIHPLEKACHGVWIAGFILSYPMWVMSHLDDYRPAPPLKGIQHLIDAGEFETPLSTKSGR